MRHASRFARTAGLILLGSLLLSSSACKRGGEDGGNLGSASRGDALFLAAAPVVVPEELGPDLDAMGIKRIYVAAGILTASGQIRLEPPPPTPIKKPVILVFMGEPGAEGQIRGGQGELLADAWGVGIQKALADAKSWATVAGVHFHFLPAPQDAPLLAQVFKALKSRFPKLLFSVTLPPTSDPAVWKPLAGAVDSVLVFGIGRRPETGDQFVPEFQEAQAKVFPVPFRLLVVTGGYGRAGSGETFDGKRIPDLELDRVSEDRMLDFDFSQVLSTEAGSIYNFKPRAGYEGARNRLSESKGLARFQVLAFTDYVKFLVGASRWAAPNFQGRVFLLDGVPDDGHIIGFRALRALLTGKPYDPVLTIEPRPGPGQKGGAEFFLRVKNDAPTSTELTRFGNWVRLRLDGGVFTSVAAGDFDRFQLFLNASEGSPQAPFSRATVCQLFENFFAPEEANEVGPIRISGQRPRAFFSYHLSLPDGRVVEGPETEIRLTPAPPEKQGKRKERDAPKKRGR